MKAERTAVYWNVVPSWPIFTTWAVGGSRPVIKFVHLSNEEKFFRCPCTEILFILTSKIMSSMCFINLFACFNSLLIPIYFKSLKVCFISLKACGTTKNEELSGPWKSALISQHQLYNDKITSLSSFCPTESLEEQNIIYEKFPSYHENWNIKIVLKRFNF